METRKLKRMLELKKRIEQAKKGEVATARHALDEAQTELAKAQAEQRARIEALERPEEVSVTELADRARYVVLAGQQVGKAREVVHQRDKTVSFCEEARMVATRDVKTFEKLNERDREERRVTQKRVEQQSADEVANSRWSPRS